MRRSSPSGTLAGPLDVFADEFGRVQFFTTPAVPGDEVTKLSLDCRDDSGRSDTYTLDRTSPSTFAVPPPVPPEQWPPGAFRPPITGDPLSYTTDQLHKMGFPSRPDPVKYPAQYSHWLEDASRPARRSFAKGHSHPHAQHALVSNYNSTQWGGAMFSAAQCTPPQVGCGGNFYCTLGHHFCETMYAAEGSWNVPAVQWESSSTLAEWVGVGGNYDGSSPCLIQDGVEAISEFIFHTPYLSYESFVELFSGLNVGGAGYAWPTYYFSVSPSDSVTAEAWACTSTGASSPTGAYGCFYLSDSTSGAFQECETTAGYYNCPSLPVINAFQGQSAEAINERAGNSPSLLPFSQFTMTYTASSQDYGGTYHSYDNANDSANLTNWTLINGNNNDMLELTTINLSSDTETFTFERSQ